MFGYPRYVYTAFDLRAFLSRLHSITTEPEQYLYKPVYISEEPEDGGIVSLATVHGYRGESEEDKAAFETLSAAVRDNMNKGKFVISEDNAKLLKDYCYNYGATEGNIINEALSHSNIREKDYCAAGYGPAALVFTL